MIAPRNFSSSVTVSGTVSDLDRNGDPAAVVSVTVNDIPASINGATFTAQSVPIVLGENQITAVAVDQSGGMSFHSITVNGEKYSGAYTEFTYDGNGNLVGKTVDGTYYTVYDYENRLVEVTLPDSTTNEFTYDGDKRRVSRQAAGGEEKWFLPELFILE